MVAQEERNRELVHEFTDAWNEADFDRLDELITDDYELHDPSGFFDPPPGIEGVKLVIEGFQTAFPDGSFSIQQMVAEEDQVMVRWIATGTHTGELFGVEPTGTEFEFDGFELERIEDGRITKTWTVYDTLGLLEQFDVLPDLPADA